MHRLILTLAALTLLAIPTKAQVGIWSDASGRLTQVGARAYAGPGEYYQDEEIIVRAGQQPILFDTGSNLHLRMTVQVNGGPEAVLLDKDDKRKAYETWWRDLPVAPGVYAVKMRAWLLGNLQVPEIYTYRLIVVPPAQHLFRDNYGNEITVWRGAGDGQVSKPVLVVEGFDPANETSAEAYFALGSDLFANGLKRGADVAILNFANGGQDMRLNAAVVEGAIGHLNAVSSTQSLSSLRA
jgi:hypothetical protein